MAVLERKARSILNKLTPQKFDKLVSQFKELDIDSEEKLAMCMELVFEKVWSIMKYVVFISLKLLIANLM